MPNPRTPMLLDLDTGIDDALALTYLLASEEAEILGIGCTAGNVPARQVADNTLAWLELCGRADIEVALGAAGPLVAPLMTAEDTHGPTGIGYADPPPARATVSARDAAQLWIDVANSRPGEITGLITGPLTNLAYAIQREPGLPRLLRCIVVMGGAFHHAGNTTPSSEWNIAVDPEAAKLVFDAFSGLPADRMPIICALDITESIAMTPRHLARLAEAAGCPIEPSGATDPRGVRAQAPNPLIRHLVDAVRFYFEFHDDQGEGYLSHMHDPFAAAVALRPEIAELRAATVDVELAGMLTRGATVADWRGSWGRPVNAWIATAADPEAFFDHLIERVGRFARLTKCELDHKTY